jgi:DNA-binding transcriptional ArsR family regulator
MDELKTMANSKTLCQRQAEFCSLFAHPVRIRLMLELGDGEKSAGELAEKLGVSQANLSQHFRLMKDRRALRCRKDGKMSLPHHQPALPPGHPPRATRRGRGGGHQDDE